MSERGPCWALAPPTPAQVEPVVRAALEEDLGRRDVTSALVLPPNTWAVGRVVAQGRFVMAGASLIGAVFGRLDSRVQVEDRVTDGEEVAPEQELVRLCGPARSLLAGERTALNFVQRLSGIATITRAFVRAVAGTGVVITDTRKTAPGLRLLEKYATAVGGAANHRFGLDDGILIKDNHLLLAGDARAAVERTRQQAPWSMKVQVECSSRGQVEAVLGGGADSVLLDNVTPVQARELIELIGRRAEVEISGGITLQNVRQYAAAKPDRISVGALTHSAPAAPIHMVVERTDAPGR